MDSSFILHSLGHRFSYSVKGRQLLSINMFTARQNCQSKNNNKTAPLPPAPGGRGRSAWSTLSSRPARAAQSDPVSCQN